MATLAATPEHNERRISVVGGACRDLFLKCIEQRQRSSSTQSRAELQRQRFHVWASYLGVFASDNAALDKRLECSDEVRNLVIQLLSLMERNLRFVAYAHTSAVSEETLVLSGGNETGEIQGTASEALDAVEATIDRLNRLGATIRKYSTADLENRVKAFTERHGDGDYSRLARQIVHFKYRTATPSLQDQLAVSMANRRQRLRYIRRHQGKLGTPKGAVSQPKEQAVEARPTTQVSRQLSGIPEDRSDNATAGPSQTRQKQLDIRPAQKTLPRRMAARSDTKASGFKPTPSSIVRMQRDERGSVISSSKNSTTFFAEDLEGFPDPPKTEASTVPPCCPFCGKPLEESDLKLGRWHRHVLEDVQPFICISDKCEQASRPFKDFEMWARHMRETHSMKWTQQVHKPTVWRCDVDHAAETFEDEDAFREHLNAEHSEYTPAQQEAIYRSSEVTRRRPRNFCPMCNVDVATMAAGDSRGETISAVRRPEKLDEFEQLHELAKHIASHLRRLAFDSANSLDEGADENAPLGSIKTSNGKRRDGSNTRPPSGLNDLSHVSLRFDDTAILKLETQVTEFDSDWSPADLALLESAPEELSSTDVLDWPGVTENLKKDMKPELIAELEHDKEPASPDPILHYFYQQRYSRTGAIADLEEAIHVVREAVESTPPDHPDRSAMLNNLGTRLNDRYARTGAMADLEEAILVVREAVESTPRDHPDLARHLNNLGACLSARYSRTGAMADLEEAIRVVREAVESTPRDHPDLARHLNNLGACLGARYARTGAMADLEEAIRVVREAVESTPRDHPDLARHLNNLGARLGARYSRTGAMADLEEAIRVVREAVKSTPPDHPDRSAMLNNLGTRLNDRYARTGAMADLEEAILVVREAVKSTPPDHPDLARHLNNLGACLSARYSRTGAMADLEEAIYVVREAVESTPPDHPDRSVMLNNLGARLGARYSRTGAMADLEEAIHVVREVVKSMPPDHPDRSAMLNNLGIRLNDRYSRTRAMADLEEAIRVVREAVESTPRDHPDLVRHLNNLGACLGARYSRTGAMADLEEAIRVVREAVESTPPDHPDRSVMLNNLGARLGARYSRTGAMADLEEAIHVVREVVKSMPPDHPDRSAMLNNLGIRLNDRYSRTRAMADLEEAIRVGREAVESTPPDHPDRSAMLNNLGTRLNDRYSRTGAMADLEEAIRVVREAVESTPPDHPDRSAMLNNLGIRLNDRYSRTRAMADLEEAIRVGREAVESTPRDHPDLARHLNNLGACLGARYSRTGAMADLEEAKQCFTSALLHPTSVISTRVMAGRHFLSLPGILEDRETYTVARTTTVLIPLLTSRSLRNTDKYHLLSMAVGISSDAAAVALHADRGALAAIELLESGRGVIAGSLFKRSDISALESTHPDLARSFAGLREQLDAPVRADSVVVGDRATMTAEVGGSQRRKVDEELSGLLKTIRSELGFERFLLSASEVDMLRAARPGPIVVLNVSSYRCDALIVEQSGIRSLELPHLSQEAIDNRIADLGSLDTLSWLWDAIVRPVLEALGLTAPPSSTPWRHMWWVPTGKLTQFPLHAAGHHLKRTGETTLDRVISSYASSVKAIIHSRRQQHQAPAAGQPQNAVVVAMENTPKQAPLGFAGAEIASVTAVCDSMGLPHFRARPYKQDVLQALETCTIFHFAGHGVTHPTEPLQSQLLLEDWDSEPFTVASLLEMNLSSKAPFLAYLSACGTGQILDAGSVDESIHLANACQLAGFRHVIGTLWSVDDGLCVDMAKMTYEFLRDEGMGNQSVSRGLHRATRTLRDRWVDGERGAREEQRPGAERYAEVCVQGVSRPGRLLWVPYVHFGA
ncbi:CHAT domain-containing protein [Coniochaeta sp. 2T2.1]|nr:CHAT domain-containing protein [Coniochaeta sp. 2T2.1]